MTRAEFDASLTAAAPPEGLSLQLQALWWIGKNKWDHAHELIDSAPGSDNAWVHAHLHRIEGDESNAGYWYRRAGRDKPNYGLSKERDVLLAYFLDK
ncbi:hypothetical protein CLV84_3830 [Neolewinella xylanilytica]|uniref:Tetratricopeptide repeat protein n=1 Tax=Neolewinella xylanilytica TaxID=1514080 RepID=A0A2S6I118_9BACT|nr:hypothetical protein [Neolewinella xylanilytica]PPK84668.1 hypothetical protein CLV84_3830 [Neolewinella xylanilytica]